MTATLCFADGAFEFPEGSTKTFSEYAAHLAGTAFDSLIAHRARTTKNKFGKPWNSINVRPGHGGARNHEAIVWNTNQIRVRYLCEFDS